MIFQEPLTYYLQRITSQYQLAPNYTQWVQGLLQPIIDLTNCLYSFFYEFDLDTASGAQLDILGDIVGASRIVPFTPSAPTYGIQEYSSIPAGAGTQVTLPTTPLAGAPVLVWRNGIKLSDVAGDYTINQNVITFTNGYTAGDVIYVAYFTAAAAATGVTEYVWVATAGGTTVTLPSTPVAGVPVIVWRSGLKLSATAGDYSISGATITFTQPYVTGDVIDVLYCNAAPTFTMQKYVLQATAAGTTVTLSPAPLASSPVWVCRGGVKLAINKDYTISGAVITFTKGYVPGDVITVVYFSAMQAVVSSILDDPTYRILIKATIGANFWNGTIDGLQQLWQGLFPGGTIFVYDHQDMSFTVVMSGTFTSIIQDLITHGMIVPRPEGVLVNYTFSGLPLFGVDLNNQYVAGVDIAYIT